MLELYSVMFKTFTHLSCCSPWLSSSEKWRGWHHWILFTPSWHMVSRIRCWISSWLHLRVMVYQNWQYVLSITFKEINEWIQIFRHHTSLRNYWLNMSCHADISCRGEWSNFTGHLNRSQAYFLDENIMPLKFEDGVHTDFTKHIAKHSVGIPCCMFMISIYTHDVHP